MSIAVCFTLMKAIILTISAIILVFNSAYVRADDCNSKLDSVINSAAEVRWTETLPILANEVHYNALKESLHDLLKVDPKKFIARYSTYDRATLHETAVLTYKYILNELGVGLRLSSQPMKELNSYEKMRLESIAHQNGLTVTELRKTNELLKDMDAKIHENLVSAIESSLLETAALLVNFDQSLVSRQDKPRDWYQTKKLIFDRGGDLYLGLYDVLTPVYFGRLSNILLHQQSIMPNLSQQTRGDLIVASIVVTQIFGIRAALKNCLEIYQRQKKLDRAQDARSQLVRLLSQSL